MRIMFLLVFLIISVPSLAEPFGPCPLTDLSKPNLMIKEIATHITRDQNGVEIFTAAWRQNNPERACCTAMHNDAASWREIFTRLLNEVRTLDNLVLAIGAGPGSRNLMQDPVILARCQTLVDGLLPVFRVVRNPHRTDGARPMFTLNTTGTRVNLRQAGVQVYVDAGHICAPEPVIERTTNGLWLYVTNSTGIRGIALCKL